MEKAKWKEGTRLCRADSEDLTDLLKSEQRHGERSKDSPRGLEGMIPSRGEAKALGQAAVLLSLIQVN